MEPGSSASYQAKLKTMREMEERERLHMERQGLIPKQVPKRDRDRPLWASTYGPKPQRRG
jgi:hypothetical protein